MRLTRAAPLNRSLCVQTRASGAIFTPSPRLADAAKRRPALPEPTPLWRAGRSRQGKTPRAQEGREKCGRETATTNRNPILLLRLFGLLMFLLRLRADALSMLLFHEPPRSTNPEDLTRVIGPDQYSAVFKHQKIPFHRHPSPARGGGREGTNRALGGKAPQTPRPEISGQSSQSPELVGDEKPQPPTETRDSRSGSSGG